MNTIIFIAVSITNFVLSSSNLEKSGGFYEEITKKERRLSSGGGMAVGLASPVVVSGSCCSGNLQQPAVPLGAPFSRTLTLARPSSSLGVSSSFCLKANVKFCRKEPTALGKIWERRTQKGSIRCQLGASSSQDDVADVPSSSGGNDTVQFDLELPRRSLLLEFTCNVCTARTQRMINPYALRRGTVYVQCGGCEKYHQLVDNLNLVEEFNFKDEGDPLRNDLSV